MKTKLIQTLFVIFLITNLSAQERTIIFNKQGKIIKNYGFNVPEKEGIDVRIIIDEITDAEKKDYFIVYQYRNNYNYETNIIGSNNTLRVLKYDTKGILYAFDEIKNNARFFNYWLIKANEKGREELLKLSKNETININSFLKEYDTLLKSTLSDFVKEGTIDVNNYVTAHKKNITAIAKYKKEEEVFKKKQSVQDKVKEELETDLASKKEILTELAKITHSVETPKYIKAVGDEITDFKKRILLKTRELINETKKVKDSLKNIAKRNKIINDSIKAKIIRHKKENQFIKKPLFTILHQGVILSKTKDIHEIVYDVNDNEILGAKNKQLEIVRITPSLPQLTTASELYAHVVNFKPDILKNNPFKISMITSSNDSVVVESVSNFKEIESSAGFSDGIFESVIGGLQKTVTSQSDASSEETEGEEIDEDKVEATTIASIVQQIGSTNNKSLKAVTKVKDNMLYAQMNFILVKDNDVLLSDEKKQYESFKDSTEFKRFDHTTLFNNMLKKVVNNKVEIQKKVLDIKNIIAVKQTNVPNYTEYILKYPRPLKANSATTVNLYANQFNIENYLKKVEKGKENKPTYNVTYAPKLLVSDELPPTHRLYRFTLTAGAMYTKSKFFGTDANNNAVELDNSGFRPSITFSTYMWQQNLNLDNPSWYNTLHADLSIDYEDADVLDNIYLGVGFEPIRKFHLGVGYRFGKTDKMVKQEIERVTNNGLYITASLGFSLIPSVIKQLF